MFNDDTCDVIRCNRVSEVKYLGIYGCDDHWKDHCDSENKFDFRKAKLKKDACVDLSRKVVVETPVVKADVETVVEIPVVKTVTLLDFLNVSNIREHTHLEG